MRRACWAFVLLAAAPGWALAHPVDEVVQGAYLTLAPNEVRLELDITPGSLVVGSILKVLDPNGDRRITEAEARAYAEMVLKQSSLAVGGRSLTWRLDRVVMPSFEALQQAGEIKVYAVASRPEQGGVQSLAYENRYQPAKSQCIANVFLQPGDAWRYQVTGQQHGADGRHFSVQYTAVRA